MDGNEQLDRLNVLYERLKSSTQVWWGLEVAAGASQLQVEAAQHPVADNEVLWGDGAEQPGQRWPHGVTHRQAVSSAVFAGGGQQQAGAEMYSRTSIRKSITISPRKAAEELQENSRGSHQGTQGVSQERNELDRKLQGNLDGCLV